MTDDLLPKDNALLDCIINIIDEVRSVDARSYYYYADTVESDRLGEHSDSEFTSVWGEITDIAFEKTWEIENQLGYDGDTYNRFMAPDVDRNHIRTFNPSDPDDFVGLSVMVSRDLKLGRDVSHSETPRLDEVLLKIYYKVEGTLRLQSRISLAEGGYLLLFDGSRNELDAIDTQELKEETLERIADFDDSNSST